MLPALHELAAVAHTLLACPGGASQSGASQSGAPPVDEWCVLEHAMEVRETDHTHSPFGALPPPPSRAQVAAMLPGGVDVVGVAVGCPADRLAALQPWLARLLPRLCPLPPSTPHSSRLLLHSPTGSKRWAHHTPSLPHSLHTLAALTHYTLLRLLLPYTLSCSSSLSRYKCQTLDLVCPQV